MTESNEALSLGLQFKNAREALKLSIEEVAQKTNLKKNHIEALENDIFILPNVPPVFVRGYVRNYARFLGLPESIVTQVNYGEVTIPKDVKKAAPIPVSNNHKSQNRCVKWLTGLILLGAVGMTLAWWWQEHKKDETSRESLVNSAEIAVNNNENSTNIVNAETPVVTVADKSEKNEVSTNVEQSQVQPAENNTAVESSAIAPIEPIVQVTDTATNSAVETSGQPLQAEATTATVAEQTPVVENTAQEQAQPEPVAVGNEELRIVVEGGQSWITVRSTKSKKSLAEKLYNSGEVLTFNDNEQYRLTIGAPAHVKIYYKGQQVPLKVDGRVARIKLPQ